ncbi:MAG: hypothetical protein ABF780_05635 [Bifidobacterium aquikefiri]|uniref:Peptidase C39-like domain-containing protein n=2 Tax=Bifidobacterium aquikefiri TaxID=1653207 RepID=A0A261G3H3_9BIFI|nr:hypothetical protein [Bifidobacterium aquikefiri]OZG65556.1 hypothetical protein BAQU_1739 [Bifidobacterium aquikefiri]
MRFSLGKLAPREAKLKLSTYLKHPLPAPPAEANTEALPIWDANMFGNDTVGDCAIAGPAHETLFWEKHNGNAVANITTENVLQMYADVTGYDPKDPDSDQGSVVADVVAYRRTHGLVDADGKKHTIAVGLGLSLTRDSVKQVINLFDACGLGIQVPSSLMDQTNNAQSEGTLPTWTVVDDSPIEGGHYVAALAYDKDYVYVNSWGMVCRMSWQFFDQYADEAWAYLSQEDLNGQGISPDGFDLRQLQEDIKNL